MTASVLVDSDVLIEVLRDRDARISHRWLELGQSSSVIAYSPITSAEIWHGARPKEIPAITALFSGLSCIPIEAAIGKRAGEYLARYHASHGMGIGDALIAATSSLHDLVLWTRNRKHYPMRDVQFL